MLSREPGRASQAVDFSLDPEPMPDTTRSAPKRKKR
jgi:hypothetical protein